MPLLQCCWAGVGGHELAKQGPATGHAPGGGTWWLALCRRRQAAGARLRAQGARKRRAAAQCLLLHWPPTTYSPMHPLIQQPSPFSSRTCLPQSAAGGPLLGSSACIFSVLRWASAGLEPTQVLTSMSLMPRSSCCCRGAADQHRVRQDEGRSLGACQQQCGHCRSLLGVGRCGCTRGAWGVGMVPHSRTDPPSTLGCSAPASAPAAQPQPAGEGQRAFRMRGGWLGAGQRAACLHVPGTCCKQWRPCGGHAGGVYAPPGTGLHMYGGDGMHMGKRHMPG